jgi:hypothetical protein
MVEDADTTCTRCSGKGVLPHFAHVMNGVCFRCWGSGEDPRSASQLRHWLVKARQEYRNRLQALRDNPPPAAERAIKADLRLIASIGKRNKARLEKLLQPCVSCQTESSGEYEDCPHPDPGYTLTDRYQL